MELALFSLVHTWALKHYLWNDKLYPDSPGLPRSGKWNLTYSAVLQMILRGWWWACGGMKSYTPGSGYRTMYYECGGRERDGFGSDLSPSTSVRPASERVPVSVDCSRIFECCQCRVCRKRTFFVLFSLFLTCCFAFGLPPSPHPFVTIPQIHFLWSKYYSTSSLSQFRVQFFFFLFICFIGWQAHSSLL